MGVLADFLAGRSPDTLGRTHAEILAYSDPVLEARHDFIQWLFPLAEPSRAVPGSPVLSRQDIEEIRTSAPAQDNMRAAAARMLGFYRANDHWLASHDHNHLRITRIIRSLRLLAGDPAADGFRDAVQEQARIGRGAINAETLQFWRES